MVDNQTTKIHFQNKITETLYFNFIKYCLNTDGYFLNYVDEQKKFTKQNNVTNLADANGRAVWALGYMLSISDLLPEELVFEAENLIQKILFNYTLIYFYYFYKCWNRHRVESGVYQFIKYMPS